MNSKLLNYLAEAYGTRYHSFSSELNLSLRMSLSFSSKGMKFSITNAFNFRSRFSASTVIWSSCNSLQFSAFMSSVSFKIVSSLFCSCTKRLHLVQLEHGTDINRKATTCLKMWKATTCRVFGESSLAITEILF